MSKTNLAIGIIIIAIGAYAMFGLGVRGSGNVIESSREVTDFTHINVSGKGNVVIKQGFSESLVIRAEDNILPRIKTTIHDDTLTIEFDRAPLSWGIFPTEDIEIFITLKQLSSITSTGSVSITGDNLVAEELNIEHSGSGSIDLGISSGEANVSVPGSGTIILNGNVNNESVEVSGSGNYIARDLVANNVTVRMSGSGTAEVFVKDSLDVSVSGSGRVRYLGNPDITEDISGSGSNEKLEPPTVTPTSAPEEETTGE